MDKSANQPKFQTLGDQYSSAVCGPDGCSIEEHRQQERKEEKSND
ncbi:hypothetical protein [Limosilactobacillus coleohominis]|nr:hypothetical protein [Limosilactobacillus coleohominis]